MKTFKCKLLSIGFMYLVFATSSCKKDSPTPDTSTIKGLLASSEWTNRKDDATLFKFAFDSDTTGYITETDTQKGYSTTVGQYGRFLLLKDGKYFDYTLGIVWTDHMTNGKKDGPYNPVFTSGWLIDRNYENIYLTTGSNALTGTYYKL